MAEAAKPSNGYDADQLKSYLDRIANKKEEIASVMGVAMRECKTHREDIKEIYVEAKANGVPVKALKAEVALREKDREKAKIVAGLDGDDEAELQAIRDALGDYASEQVGDSLVEAERQAA